MWVAAIEIVAIAVIGFGLTGWIGVPLRLEERVCVGGVVGMLSVGIAAFVGFQISGMSASTMVFALLVTGSPAVAGAWLDRERMIGEAATARKLIALRWGDPRSLRPLATFTVACAAVSTRVLALGYQTTPRGVSAGHLSTYADWAAHLAYAGSFAYGDNRALESPIAAGSPIHYHFLANFLGGLFTTAGITLPQALLATTWLFAVLLPPLMWCVVMRIVRSRTTACVSILLFTLTGGVGAWYFLQDARLNGIGIITDLPRMYSRITDQHLWLDNTISASLYAQRSTQFGIGVGLTALLLILAARPGGRHRGFLAAGLLVGVCAIVWVHMALTALTLGVLAAARDRQRIWWWFLAPGMVIAVPLAAWISPDEGSLRWGVGWMAPEADQSWIVFWLRNAALLLPLFAAIAVLGGVPGRLRTLSAPFWLWFIVPNIIAFHPWLWNNTKFFVFWQWAGAIVIASWLVGVARAAHGATRIVGAVTAAAVAASLTITGALDTLKAMQRSSAIAWVDADDLVAAEWLRENARPGERLVYGATNTSAVAALGGVPALSGYPGWTADLGLRDWAERARASEDILAGTADAAALVARHGIDYVVIGPRERAEVGADDRYWEREGTLVFTAGDYRIYRT